MGPSTHRDFSSAEGKLKLGQETRSKLTCLPASSFPVGEIQILSTRFLVPKAVLGDFQFWQDEVKEVCSGFFSLY